MKGGRSTLRSYKNTNTLTTSAISLTHQHTISLVFLHFNRNSILRQH